MDENAGDSKSFPISRPGKPGSWVVVARSKKVAGAWDELTNQFSSDCQFVHDRLSNDPKFDDGDRQHPLEGAPGKATYQGRTYKRWQIDVGGGSRVWYFIDETADGKGQKRRSGTVIIDQVLPGHPKSTEKGYTGKRRPGRN